MQFGITWINSSLEKAKQEAHSGHLREVGASRCASQDGTPEKDNDADVTANGNALKKVIVW